MDRAYSVRAPKRLRGLGRSIDEIKVVWSSGFSNVMTGVTTDQEIIVTERAVISQTPHAGDTNAGVGSNVTAVFSGPVTAVGSSTFTVQGSLTGERAGSYSGEGSE